MSDLSRLYALVLEHRSQALQELQESQCAPELSREFLQGRVYQVGLVLRSVEMLIDRAQQEKKPGDLKVVTADNATPGDVYLWTTEWSTLGLRIGAPTPKTLETTLGNGMPFEITGVNGDYATYMQVAGCLTLKVFND
jgi:hypothetical protein